MKKLFLIIIIMFSIQAQSTDKTNIKETINNYFVGYRTGNIDMLKKVFHPDVIIKYIRFKDRKYAELSMPQLFHFMNNLPSGWKVESKIDFINIHGTAAQAKVTVKVPQIIWTDFISLLKLDGQWLIVSKISHGDLITSAD